MKPNIAIIGRGNVGTHLAKAFSPKAIVKIINPHTLDFESFQPDVCIIAVSDDAILPTAARLSHLDCIIAHTSGTTPLITLKGAGVKRPGVLYPLQTFTKGIDLDYSEIPVFIEGDTPDIEWILTDIAKLFSANVKTADSKTRRRLHLASVVSCNFVNHLWTLAADNLAKADLSLDVLYPLMNETLRKAMVNGPKDSQTGPARRDDQPTIYAHLEMLEDDSNLHDIYSRLSDSITNYYKKNECN